MAESQNRLSVEAVTSLQQSLKKKTRWQKPDKKPGGMDNKPDKKPGDKPKRNQVKNQRNEIEVVEIQRAAKAVETS